MSEVVWKVARAYLYYLRQEHPSWTHTDLAKATEHSSTWVDKWVARFQQVPR